VRFAQALRIMKRQVTQTEYWTCVEDGGCPSGAPASSISADEPVVSVSWRDAAAYVDWFSRKTGKKYRLPTDAEWAFASGSRFHDEGWPDADSSDPAKRWLARYEADSEQEPVDKMSRTIGSFGANMACSISPAMSGNGPTPALSESRLVIPASRRSARRIAVCGWWKGAIAPT
jgi:formylglycine-generating enzyme required for sulfatase activity